MADLGKAYVQIIPKAEGISEKIKNQIGGGAGSAGEAGGASFVSKFSKIVGGAALGATVVKGIKSSLDAGGKLQQSFGGLDTIYGDASAAAKEYAAQAASAGISMNDYAEQAVSFGASLKQAFEGDTAAAAEAANTAILDMADNAAKMGTPLESIQNAYQGFAKGNYTMLDNLKLGYGGTKSEMERLLADATKLTGVKYDMNNLGDVYSAIHAIQGDLGLTGVAAAEASGTFTGSLGAMKASAENLMAQLTTGGDIEPALRSLVGNASAFLMNNLLPMIGSILQQIPVVISTFISECAPTLLEQGAQLLTNLVNGIVTGLPQMAQAAADAITQFAAGFGAGSEGAANLIAKAYEMMTQLGGALMEAAGILIPAVIEMMWRFFSETDWIGLGTSVVQSLINAFNTMFPKAIDIVRRAVADIARRLGFAGLAAKVSSVFNSVKDRITEPIEKAKELVKSAIEKIKGFFPISIGRIMDNISLPHFNITGGEAPYGLMGRGYPPSIDVEWYARGGIVDNANIIGVGEAGPEAVIPLSGQYMRPFAKAIADAEEKDYGQLAGVVYRAVSAALNDSDLSIRIDKREFGRILREAGAV